jgi:hypothetical protein
VRQVTYSVQDLPSDLGDWIRKRSGDNHPLEIIHFIGCHAEGLQKYAEKLRNDGVVDSVMWSTENDIKT